MIYFDYDGVIGNTEIGLFDEYYRQKEKDKELTKIQYLIDFDWRSWLRKAGPKDNAFNILNSHAPSTAQILTRCWSVSEAKEKIIYMKENGVKNTIIIVPYDLPKTMVVEAKGSILVEDQLCNAVDWIKSGGIALMLGKQQYAECPSISSIEEAFKGYWYERPINSFFT